MLFVAALIVALVWVPSPWSWVLIGAAAVIEVGESFGWLWWNRRRRARVGVETLIGRRAVVVAPCYPDGQVRLDGELWQARCEEGANSGVEVTVRAIDGLTLEVERYGATRAFATNAS